MAAATIYLDYNATTPVRPVAADAVARALCLVGNPSSVHGFGRQARRRIEDAREAVADWLGAPAAGVIFTSGGTEANALALAGCGRSRVLVSAIEHPSVLNAVLPGRRRELIPVDGDGVVDLSALEALLADSDEPALVALMLANNETGVVQPVAAAAAIAHAHGALLHCDAVQAAGKLAIDVAALGADSLSLSAHKLGGPQGVGVLVLADPDAPLEPLLGGGGQERRRRSGTENLPGIAGFAAALEAVRDEAPMAVRLRELRDRLEGAIKRVAPDVIVFGAQAPRLPNTSCLALPGMTAQTAVMALDLAGIAISAGSACSSGKVAPSHVLTAMGAGPLAASAIRVSLGWASVDADVERFVEAFGGLVRQRADPGVASAMTLAKGRR
jgi:cysteine desulfurase